MISKIVYMHSLYRHLDSLDFMCTVILRFKSFFAIRNLYMNSKI